MEYFTDPWDLFYLSTWVKAHRGLLEKGGPFLNNLKGDRMAIMANLISSQAVGNIHFVLLDSYVHHNWTIHTLSRWW